MKTVGYIMVSTGTQVREGIFLHESSGCPLQGLFQPNHPSRPVTETAMIVFRPREYFHPPQRIYPGQFCASTRTFSLQRYSHCFPILIAPTPVLNRKPRLALCRVVISVRNFLVTPYSKTPDVPLSLNGLNRELVPRHPPPHKWQWVMFYFPQQYLYFLPLPHGQGSFLPIFAVFISMILLLVVLSVSSSSTSSSLSSSSSS